MCPMCIGVATWYVAGASSAGGIAALALKRSRARSRREHCGGHGDADANRDAGDLTARPSECEPSTGQASPDARR